ncbi:MAG: hypothetical protein HWN65_04680, partial [Candidatus Helarchaeota archaeon]|nr:hypothetical protein [Candidatus Helarchaeota archaeon]
RAPAPTPASRAPAPAPRTTTYAPKIRHSAPLISSPTITVDVEWRESSETMKVLTVAGDVIKEVENLNSDEVGIIIDKPNGIIWVWKGSRASRLNAIRASTKAPSVRSGYRLYDWKVEFIDEGDEPKIFPFNIISS